MIAGGSSFRHIRDETTVVPNMAKRGSTCNYNYLYRWLPCQYFILLLMGAWRPKHVEKVYSNKICILLHHVGVLFDLIEFLLMLETKGVRKGESLTFSALLYARGTEVIYYIDVNRRHFRTDILKWDLRFPQLREDLTSYQNTTL